MYSFLSLFTKPAAEPIPRDYALIPLDESYGDDEDDSEPFFRLALPDPNADAQHGLVGFGLGYALGRGLGDWG